MQKAVLLRFVAVLLLVIPGVLATYGFLEVKNALFEYVAELGDGDGEKSFQWLRLLKGIVLFFAGAGFIGGWIFFRDRKRNYVAPRFKSRRHK